MPKRKKDTTVKDTKAADKILEQNEEKIAAEQKAKDNDAKAKARKDNPGRGDAIVLDSEGRYERTYSAEHNDPKGLKGGKDYKEKAEGYARKIGGSVRKG
jgi:hypothetical protein|tara:strand:- start:24578 stop:24877 length:300 start_codon:yes stop_codon:yes gene_type:complete